MRHERHRPRTPLEAGFVRSDLISLTFKKKNTKNLEISGIYIISWDVFLFPSGINEDF